jgi:hypothetical protein
MSLWARSSIPNKSAVPIGRLLTRAKSVVFSLQEISLALIIFRDANWLEYGPPEDRKYVPNNEGVSGEPADRFSFNGRSSTATTSQLWRPNHPAHQFRPPPAAILNRRQHQSSCGEWKKTREHKKAGPLLFQRSGVEDPKSAGEFSR